MHICKNIHGFIWESMTQNNCNTYLIDGPTRILIDPGHLNLFDHVKQGLAEMDLGIADIGLVICTHAHPDHLESVQLFQDTSTKVAYHQQDKVLITGDLIFKEGVGRTDLPGGNGAQLKESIRRMHALDVEWILPGHGPIVAGANEVERTFEQIENFWFAHI